jgi:NTP pyrophosphatase (non-canonical NTP hydrolase)
MPKDSVSRVVEKIRKFRTSDTTEDTAKRGKEGRKWEVNKEALLFPVNLTPNNPPSSNLRESKYTQWNPLLSRLPRALFFSSSLSFRQAEALKRWKKRVTRRRHAYPPKVHEAMAWASKEMEEVFHMVKGEGREREDERLRNRSELDDVAWWRGPESSFCCQKGGRAREVTMKSLVLCFALCVGVGWSIPVSVMLSLSQVS